MTLTVTAIGPMPRGSMPAIAEGTADARLALKGNREVFFEEAGGYIACETYERSRTQGEQRGPRSRDHRADGHHDRHTSRRGAQVDKYGTLIVELALTESSGSGTRRDEDGCPHSERGCIHARGIAQLA